MSAQPHLSRRHLLFGAVTFAAATPVLASCTSGGTATTAATGATGGGGAATGGTVHVLLPADFSYLDPARGWDGGVNNFYRLVYRQLTTAAPGNASDPNAMVPDLATDLGTPSADGMTWTFTLKDGLVFDDGSPITSAEVKFGISRAWDPKSVGSPYAKLLIAAPDDYKGPYESGEHPGIATPDAKTIVFTLKAPFNDFSAAVGQVNMTPFPVGKGGGDEFLTTIIASGPYSLDSYTAGQTVQLKRNPHWDATTDQVRTAHPDAWKFEVGLDSSTIDERLIAGQGTDASAIGGQISNSTVARVQTPQLKERLIEWPGVSITYLGLNTTKAPLDKLEVRQAISYALDKTAIQNATGGSMLADIATTFIVPTIAGHKDFDLYPSDGHKGDVAKAKALLATAGVPDGFAMTLDCYNLPVMQAQAEAVQQSLARIGITVTLNVIEASKYYETIGTTALMHEAAITGWSPDWASSAITIIPPIFDGRRITPTGNSNIAQLNDPAVNAKIDEISAMTDTAAANKAWGDLDEQIMGLAPVVPLVATKQVMLPGANVTDLFSSPGAANGGIDYVLVGLKDPKAS